MDGLSAYFDGKDINDNVQAGEFMRRLRPVCQIPGKPSVLVAANPVKNAGPDQLVPYGGGAVLNEVDGNLCSKFEDNVVELHWQGKLRGLEFKPLLFKFEIHSSPSILDNKGRQVVIPTLRPLSISEAATRALIKKETRKGKPPAGLSVARQALNKMIDELPDPLPIFPGLPVGTVAIDIKGWRQLSIRLGISAGEERAQQKAFKEAVEWMRDAGEIAILDDLAYKAPKPKVTVH